MTTGPARPEGIARSGLPGPFAVGAYARGLRDFLRQRPRVQVFGEVWNLRVARTRVFFELRDRDGALPCAMWRERFDALRLPEGALADGTQLVVAGGPDYYPGSPAASPGFAFDVTAVRIAGEGDLLAQLAELRRKLDAEGLFEPQKVLGRPALPHTIGVVTGEQGKARDDVLAGLRRRGWAGRLVWAFAPVQDRRAAPAITRALQDLAALDDVDVVIVARGGGSLADLFAFCDETLCRTVALLRVPVIASVGHHTDRTLLDDVAAFSASTPTHAAEAAVALDVGEARRDTRATAAALARHGRRAVVERARHLARMGRVPGEHLARSRRALHQQLRELRAAATRRVALERAATTTRAEVLRRKAAAGAGAEADARRRALDGLALALTAHDPRRVLERGYAIVDDRHGKLVTSAARARETGALRVTFSDASVDARIEE
ncbi:MAG TPA: exodeoxyribonuclease VII large subunit [Solirubrobacteraceae bacterium]|nr:exodeoxyribonuclease VII large subunit [Solirubrobacteraceae bacterium]